MVRSEEGGWEPLLSDGAQRKGRLPAGGLVGRTGWEGRTGHRAGNPGDQQAEGCPLEEAGRRGGM